VYRRRIYRVDNNKGCRDVQLDSSYLRSYTLDLKPGRVDEGGGGKGDSASSFGWVCFLFGLN